jgi:DNA-directed RNA polymerase subunit M/transcription elongation factor TFIIS
MATCPCCSNLLLRHIRQQGIYWFCRSCHAEMPNLEALKIAQMETYRLPQPAKQTVTHLITYTSRGSAA